MKVGDKRSYENMKYVCHLCHESFASKIDLYKDYLKHIAFFKCEIYKSDKIQFRTRREYVSHMKTLILFKERFIKIFERSLIQLSLKYAPGRGDDELF